MQYREIVPGQFLSRPNRFIAEVLLGQEQERVHVKNTGRCRELLLPGAAVALARAENPARKTRYDLVAVEKAGLGWVNIDSQAPNQVVGEWLAAQDFSLVKPEYTYGASRVDFYMERGRQRFLLEVKGCTLEVDGIGYFPDAPTQRGIKHLEELAGASKKGLRCGIAFVIQMPGVREVRPNLQTHPAFGAALDAAREAGVYVLQLGCKVTPAQLVLDPGRMAVPREFFQ